CHLHFTARFWNRYSASLFLAGRPASQPEAPGSWRRLQLLIWFLVSLAFLPGVLLGLLIVGVPFPLPRDCLSFVQSDWFSRLSPITEEAIVLGVALCIMGRDGRESVRSSIRLPRSEEHTSELQSPYDLVCRLLLEKKKKKQKLKH